jgi:hypothetical protein
MERYDGICKAFVASAHALGLVNVSKLEALFKTSQTFTDDQVHLDTDSGKTYVNEMLYYADNLFTAEIVNLEEGTSNMPDRIGKKKEKRPKWNQISKETSYPST